MCGNAWPSMVSCELSSSTTLHAARWQLTVRSSLHGAHTSFVLVALEQALDAHQPSSTKDSSHEGNAFKLDGRAAVAV